MEEIAAILEIATLSKVGTPSPMKAPGVFEQHRIGTVVSARTGSPTESGGCTDVVDVVARPLSLKDPCR